MPYLTTEFTLLYSKCITSGKKKAQWMIIGIHFITILKLYCCSSLLRSYFSYPVIRASIQLCFIVVLINLRPTVDGEKVVVKQI